MKIAIIGAGAIGGYVGARLALAGEDVTFIVRGANLEAIRRDGIKLVMHDGSKHVARNVRATDNYANAGPHDIVILAMKVAFTMGPVRCPPLIIKKKRTGLRMMQTSVPIMTAREVSFIG